MTSSSGRQGEKACFGRLGIGGKGRGIEAQFVEGHCAGTQGAEFSAGTVGAADAAGIGSAGVRVTISTSYGIGLAWTKFTIALL